MEEEVYYMKLEALWILTNLAFTTRVNTMRLLASRLDIEVLQQRKPELMQDMKYGRSVILANINTLML